MQQGLGCAAGCAHLRLDGPRHPLTHRAGRQSCRAHGKRRFQDGVRASLLLQLARECFHTQAEFIKLIINYFPNGAFSQTNGRESIRVPRPRRDARFLGSEPRASASPARGTCWWRILDLDLINRPGRSSCSIEFT